MAAARPSARTTPDAGRLRALAAATDRLDPPFAVIDAVALEANARRLASRAGGLPVRVATKSVRIRHVLERTLASSGFAGLLAFTLDEALWLVERGFDDVLVAYPTVDRGALGRLTGDPRALAAVTLVVDDVAQLDIIEASLPDGVPPAPVRLALDIDASLRVGRVHLGARRSPVHTPQEAARLAAAVARRPWARLHGLMLYDAQVAGQQDTLVMRPVKRASLRELAVRRGAVERAVRDAVPGLGELFVNAGGTGSLELVAADPAVTELAAGSGLFAPALFDRYDHVRATPAAFFVAPVVRRPAAGVVTVATAGFVASGAAGRDRLPRPVHPTGLRLLPREGAGETQTPLVGKAASGMVPGDRVWFRHAKAGELFERFDVVHVVEADGSLVARPTYRGEGRCFG